MTADEFAEKWHPDRCRRPECWCNKNAAAMRADLAALLAAERERCENVCRDAAAQWRVQPGAGVAAAGIAEELADRIAEVKP